MNNAFPIEAALVDFLVLIVNILRACKHLLVALLLAESDYILTSVLQRNLRTSSLDVVAIYVIAIHKLLIL
jgi:hypothetical protein